MKILLGLSGGVDSAAAALLLQKTGYEVTGCYLLMSGCDGKNDAEKLAERLGINFIVRDCRESFKKNVENYFISSYMQGITPSPCVICNPLVKIKELAAAADENGIEKIATGHYAVTTEDGALLASPSKKDQSYFLYRVPQKFLSRCLMPLGAFKSKDEIRSIAAAAELEVAAKKDSQDICFLPDGDYREFIKERVAVPCAPGDFLNTNGVKIGRHGGIMNYTVGQRKGLGAFGEPMYVSAINPSENTVTLCRSEERFKSEIKVKNAVFSVKYGGEREFEAAVKIRSAAKAAPAKISVCGDCFTAAFAFPVSAPCPGQHAVIYCGDTVLGGGEIE